MTEHDELLMMAAGAAGTGVERHLAAIAGPVSAGDQPLAVPRAMCPIDTTSPLISYSTRYRPTRSRRRPGDPYGNDPARA